MGHLIPPHFFIFNYPTKTVFFFLDIYSDFRRTGHCIIVVFEERNRVRDVIEFRGRLRRFDILRGLGRRIGKERVLTLLKGGENDLSRVFACCVCLCHTRSARIRENNSFFVFCFFGIG
jgi:hypothetical protein